MNMNNMMNINEYSESFLDVLRSVKANTAQEQEGLTLLIQREFKREESGLNALMDKFNSARSQGLDISERDKTQLLALLLDDRLEGVGNWN